LIRCWNGIWFKIKKQGIDYKFSKNKTNKKENYSY
jgi:hypothetical protein